MAKCKNCGRAFHATEKYKNSIYCGKCRKYHKKCEVCNKEIFVQARTCSKKCAYELRKQSWKQTCGAEHNFSKNSKSRKEWEIKLLKEEGIKNVFQRTEVKKKCIRTACKHYNIDNITNISQIPEIKEKIKQTFEQTGYWNINRKSTEYDIYRYNVWQITNESIKKYWIKDWKKDNQHKFFKDKFAIDHKYSVSKGFKDKISPEIIGSIINLEILTCSENSKKGSKCSLSLNKLINDYQNFLNENKINKTN